MQLSTAKRGGRVARRGTKAWVLWKGVKRAAPGGGDGHSTGTVAGAAGIGAVTGFLVSKLTRRRRNEAPDRTVASFTESGGKYDDVTLARKVETEIFRPADAPKGDVSVMVAAGVVELRGQVDDSDQIERLGKAAHAVEGVKDVRNLLHTA